jgi:predicted permease
LWQEDKTALQPGRSITESRSHGRTRSVLVVSEIALSMLLVVGALSVTMHFVSLLRVDPGVDPRNALVMSVQLPPAHYAKDDDQRGFYHALLAKLSALPSVTAVGGSVDTPFTGWYSNGDFEYEGQPAGAARIKPIAEKHYITTGYLAAIGASLWQGRDFTAGDKAGAPQVAIVNRSMAQKLWPGQSAIGKKIKPGNDWVSIVGVVRDIEFSGPGEPPANEIFTPIDQVSAPFLTFVVRTSPSSTADPLSLAEPARAAVASIDSRLAVSDVSSFGDLSQNALAGQRTSTTVTSVLGVLALLLASVGIYGVMAYSVSRREREFGIRIALGANRARILRLLYSAVFRLVLAGVSLGIVLAFGARAWLESMLGAKGAGPGAIVAGALLLSAVAAIAAAAPARRATRVHPVEALRSE